MSKIKFGIGALQAAQENYQIILDKLIRGYQKIMKKDPEGLDLIKIKQEAKQRAEDSAKVVDMEGKTLNPDKPIMGGTQDFGENIRKIYDEAKGPGKGDEMVEALKSPGARKSTEIIEKQIQETFPDIKLFGDETFEEILEIQRTGKHPRMKADGGRINFALGGPTNIIGAGLGSLEGLTPMEGVGALGAATGLMAGGVERPSGGYEIESGMPGSKENRDKALEDIFDELPKDIQDTIRDQQMKDIEGQTAGLGVLSFLNKTLGPTIGQYVFNRGRDKIVQKGITIAEEAARKKRQEELIKEQAMKSAEVVAAMAAANRASGTGGYQSSFGGDSDFMGGSGTAAEMGSFARGGLATMFTRKR